MSTDDQVNSTVTAAAAASETASPDMTEDRLEPLPRSASSDRILWIGVAVAVLGHLLPFVYWGLPDPLGEGVLTEAIAVEFIDKATFEGKDQTRPSPPVAGAPPPQPAPLAQMPPGPPQKPQQAVPPSPPPAPAVAAQPAPQTAKPETAPPPKALPAFDGEDRAAMPKAREEPREPQKPAAKPVEPKPAAKPEPAQVKPQQPQPQRPPPQKAVAPQAPAVPPAAKAAAARDASSPALAKSGEVSRFAKEVVAALAKAKPNAPGIKGSVTVTVVVAFGGGVRTAKVTGPSGREDLDTLALEAARKAKLPPPPPDVSTDDLFYDVEYKFE